MGSCTGTYSHLSMSPTTFTVSANFKRCEGSVVDWIRGVGPMGPGLHIYCFYDQDENEMDIGTLTFNGYKKTYVWNEVCFDSDPFAWEEEWSYDPNHPVFENPKDDHDYGI